MQEPVLNNSTQSVLAVAAVLSVAAGFYLFQRHIGGQPLLRYEPRRRVPWGPLALAIPLFFVVINLWPVPTSEVPTVEPDNPQHFIYGGLITSTMMIGFVVIVMGWLLSERKADWRDLGLPQDKPQFWRDVRSGCVACLAALLPIYLLNWTLVLVFQSQEQHPLVEELLKHPSPLFMLVGVLSAVVAAPLFEEFTFRVLLQGWLERLEDERLDYAATLREPVEVVANVADGNGELTAAAPVVFSADEPRPQYGWIPALPHGWTPILITAVVFGLAHAGHGVAPVPMVCLGVVLGYLYQRTHRIAPVIAAHMLFNAYSLTLLWLQVAG
jgi:membrane protease YdiL (CAAX protease family)